MAGNSLLHLLIITHDAVRSISSDINQKCWKNLRSLKLLPQLIVARELGHCEQTMVVNISNKFKAYLKSKRNMS